MKQNNEEPWNSSTYKPSVIVTGLRAGIAIDHKIRAGESRTYFTPGFYVDSPGYGSSSAFFRIRKHGYKGAYIRAVKKYACIHKISGNGKLALFAKIPDKSVFTDYLINRIRHEQGMLSKKELNKKLDVVSKSGNREKLCELLNNLDITPKDVVKILSKGNPDKSVTERAVKSWICDPNLSDARTCDDWVIERLLKR
jgi:hypothetical protein